MTLRKTDPQSHEETPSLRERISWSEPWAVTEQHVMQHDEAVHTAQAVDGIPAGLPSGISAQWARRIETYVYLGLRRVRHARNQGKNAQPHLYACLVRYVGSCLASGGEPRSPTYRVRRHVATGNLEVLMVLGKLIGELTPLRKSGPTAETRNGSAIRLARRTHARR
jgi:hypothetical protein